MQINLTGRNIDITPALRARVEKGFKRVVKHFDHLIDVHVILGVDSHQQRAEVTVSGGGRKFFADANTENMYVSIDQMVDRLDKQLLKHKDKLKDHSHDIPLKSMDVN